MTKPRTGAGKAPAPKRRISGRNLLPLVSLRAEPTERDLWDLAAARLGIDRNTFLRRAANELAEATAAADVAALSGGRATVSGGRIVRAKP